MKKKYRTALGRMLNMDSIRLRHEETIAVGNMKVNARGDELGPGGEVIRTRNEVMENYYKMHDGVIHSDPVSAISNHVPPPQPAPDQRSINRIRGNNAKRILEDQDGVE